MGLTAYYANLTSLLSAVTNNGSARDIASMQQLGPAIRAVLSVFDDSADYLCLIHSVSFRHGDDLIVTPFAQVNISLSL